MANIPLMRGGDGIKMDFDGRSISYSLDQVNFFVARITGRDGCSGTPAYIYAWEEMEPVGNGITYQAKAGGRVGTLTKYPAFELNNVAVDNNKLVFMRERCYATGAFTCPTYTGSNINTLVYDFDAGGSAVTGDCPKVSSVQCTSGMLVVTYQLGCESTTDPEQLCPTTGPVGSILLWSKSTIPSGWLECNGTTYNTTTYPALFSVLGTNVLPDLKGRFVLSRNDPSLPLGTTGSITGGSGTPTLNNIALIYIIKAAN